MLKCVGGPAEGKVGGLLVRRAPKYLRVVCKGGKEWDALDQLDDIPAADEAVYAYRLVANRGNVHVQMAGPGGRGRRCFWAVLAEYAVVEPQPADGVMRDNALWRAWCVEQNVKAFAGGAG